MRSTVTFPECCFNRKKGWHLWNRPSHTALSITYHINLFKNVHKAHIFMWKWNYGHTIHILTIILELSTSSLQNSQHFWRNDVCLFVSEYLKMNRVSHLEALERRLVFAGTAHSNVLSDRAGSTWENETCNWKQTLKIIVLILETRNQPRPG